MFWTILATVIGVIGFMVFFIVFFVTCLGFGRLLMRATLSGPIQKWSRRNDLELVRWHFNDGLLSRGPFPFSWDRSTVCRATFRDPKDGRLRSGWLRCAVRPQTNMPDVNRFEVRWDDEPTERTSTAPKAADRGTAHPERLDIPQPAVTGSPSALFRFVVIPFAVFVVVKILVAIFHDIGPLGTIFLVMMMILFAGLMLAANLIFLMISRDVRKHSEAQQATSPPDLWDRETDLLR